MELAGGSYQLQTVAISRCILHLSCCSVAFRVVERAQQTGSRCHSASIPYQDRFVAPLKRSFELRSIDSSGNLDLHIAEVISAPMRKADNAHGQRTGDSCKDWM